MNELLYSIVDNEADEDDDEGGGYVYTLIMMLVHTKAIVLFISIRYGTRCQQPFCTPHCCRRYTSGIRIFIVLNIWRK